MRDFASDFYGPGAGSRFFRNPAYTRVEATSTLEPGLTARPGPYFLDSYSENLIPNVGIDIQLYKQLYEASSMPISRMPELEHIPQTDLPEPSVSNGYDKELARALIEMDLKELFGDKVLDSEMEDMDSVDNWIDVSNDDVLAEPEPDDVVVDVAFDDVTASDYLAADLMDDYSPDDMLDNFLVEELPDIEHSLDDILDDIVDDEILDNMEYILAEPAAIEMHELDPLEDLMEIQPYMI